jgi:protein-L-isoaspartate O-methyltransferase
MAVTVPASTWRALARRLADELDGDGDLRTPQWRDALLAVPRHEFVPCYYIPEPDARPLRWMMHEPRDAETTQRWLDLVYSPTTLITDLADYVDRGVQAPVSSATKPDLMIRMLEALEVTDGMLVLEIGTGTGYNAALLAHRLGGQQVCSVDIDPQLVSEARHRLARLGYTPTVVTADGADGLAGHAPFDRIIATCAVIAVPAAWIEQLRPGGLALVHVEGPLGAGNLLALRRGTAPVLQGRFLPWWGCFMRRRAAAGATVGYRYRSAPPSRR